MMRLMGRRNLMVRIWRWMRSKREHTVYEYKNGRLALQRKALELGV
jgi:hypothetical protein